MLTVFRIINVETLSLLFLFYVVFAWHMTVADKQSSIQLVLINIHTVKSLLVFPCWDY